MELGQFSQAEYLTIFIAFIYGYIAHEFFQGWGRILRGKDRSAFSKLHLLWTLLVFGILIDFWWGSWERSDKISINIGYFTLSLIPTFIFYVIGIVLFPMKLGMRSFDIRSYFKKMFSTFLGLIMLLFASNIIIDLAFLEFDLFTIENSFRLGAIAFAGMGIIIKKRFFHLMLLILGWALLISQHIIK